MTPKDLRDEYLRQHHHEENYTRWLEKSLIAAEAKLKWNRQRIPPVG